MAEYENHGPSKEDAIKDAKKTFKNKKVPDFVIEKNVQFEINRYGGLGSFRGYCTYTRKSIENNINKDMLIIEEKIKIIEQNMYFQMWMNHILYRCPDKSHKFKVLRYEDASKDFNSRKNYS